MGTDLDNHRQALTAWRALSIDQQIESMPTPTNPARPPAINPYRERIDLIRGCDYRGGPAPGSGACNCLRICYRGCGRPIPGCLVTSVCFRDCLECIQSPTS